jgi:hypothetical protein
MLAATLTLLALTTAGCGSGDDPVDPDAATTSESPTSPTPSEPPATEDSEEPTTDPSGDPCTLVTDADVKDAFGVDVGAGEPGRGQHVENDVEYTSTNCEWEADDALELSLDLSTAEDFGGTLACTPVSHLGDEGTPVKVAGAESATWLASEEPNEIEARLRVCTAEATMNFELDAASGAGVETLRQQTTKLAAKAVAALG